MKVAAVLVVVLVLAAIGGWLWFLNACEDDWCFIFEWQKIQRVNSFEDCARLGFPIMESYPRQCRAGDKSFVEEIKTGKEDLIRVLTPRLNQIIESPVVIEGEARGYWFFEASFPIELLDANRTPLGVAVAQAQGEWMTEDFVPFQATLYFDPPTAERGTLVLKKDNPSGLPEHDDKFEIPVTLVKMAEPAEAMAMKLFFSSSEKDPGAFDCANVFAVTRRIEKTEAPARRALEELLKGPTGSEVKAGYFTSINPGVKIQKLTIESGIANVDFDDTLERAVGGA